tara:strand:+ start:161 stop:514 length:354 start_codon:yes stop_codon:yes gene_type:complete
MNRHGLDSSYFKLKLGELTRDADNYTPDEMARALLRLVCVASPVVMTESEFALQRQDAIHGVVNGRRARAEDMKCPDCQRFEMKFTRLYGWYCIPCETGPWVLGVNGVVKRTLTAGT